MVSAILKKSNLECMYNLVFKMYLAPTINFNQSAYNVDEDDGPAQPVLVLSYPSSTDITISVFSTDGSATGKDKLLSSTLTH